MTNPVLHVKGNSPLFTSTVSPALGRNGKTKVTEYLTNKILQLNTNKTSIPDIARTLNVAYSTAWRVINGFHKPKQQKLNRKKKTKFFEHDDFYK